MRSWLATYSQIISDRTQKPVFKIETDFSWALLKSAVFAFNGLEIKEYLECTYSIATGETSKSDLQGFTVIHLCSNHIIKAISKNIKGITANNEIYNLIMYVFTGLQDCTSLVEAGDIFQNLLSITKKRKPAL